METTGETVDLKKQASDLKMQDLKKQWTSDARWRGVVRPYEAGDVRRLQGSVHIEHTLARLGAERLWNLLHTESYVPALGAMTGNQAVQQVKAGLKAIYVSGWQAAADANEAGTMYPDLNLYPSDSVPKLAARLNQALVRADQIAHEQGKDDVHWFAPLVADGDTGFGGALNSFELMKAMIEAGVACVHFEDQSSSAKKCGHLGGKVLVPTKEAVQRLVAARLAADVMEVPTLIMARTDAESASLLTSDADPYDHEFMTGERTDEGLFVIRKGVETAIARALAYAPFADLIWCETSTPDLNDAREFAEAVLARYPGKMLAYNCSPSFNWRKHLDELALGKFQRELGAMGYRFQFVTLAGFHALNLSMFDLARAYKEGGMAAYSRLQEKEFGRERDFGYEAVKHQRFAGTGYFDAVQQTIVGGMGSTLALKGSTEAEQFDENGAGKKGAEQKSGAAGKGNGHGKVNGNVNVQANEKTDSMAVVSTQKLRQ
ncbi:MAG: isocitrate lyase [Terriglobales bacterium]